MHRQVRNHTITGIFLLISAFVIAFGATQPWVTGAVQILGVGPLAGARPNGGLGFDQLLVPGGRAGDVTPVLLGAAAGLGVTALLLLVTRIRGLGLLWRMVALVATAVPALVAFSAWSVVEDPASVVADDGSFLGVALDTAVSAVEGAGLAAVDPGVGLWLLTVGSALAAIGVFVPAIRSRVPLQDGSPAGPWQSGSPGLSAVPPGWYPDQRETGALRFFDGARWTAHTRPHESQR